MKASSRAAPAAFPGVSDGGSVAVAPSATCLSSIAASKPEHACMYISASALAQHELAQRPRGATISIH